MTKLKLYTLDKLSSTIFCCPWVRYRCHPTKSPLFSNTYRHTSPLLTLYHLIPSSTNLYWPSTSQYRHILTQYHQVPLIIHHLVRHSSANWIISLFSTHFMSHARCTWFSYNILCSSMMLFLFSTFPWGVFFVFTWLRRIRSCLVATATHRNVTRRLRSRSSGHTSFAKLTCSW